MGTCPAKLASEPGGFHLLRSCSSSNWDNSREQIKVEPGTCEFQVGQLSRQTRFCKEIACLQRFCNGFRSLCNKLAVAGPLTIHRAPAPSIKFEGYDHRKGVVTALH